VAPPLPVRRAEGRGDFNLSLAEGRADFSTLAHKSGVPLTGKSGDQLFF
jgi:hypothetical protein